MAWVPRWPGCRRHRRDSGLCTVPSATAGVSPLAHMARSAPGHMSTSSSGQDVALWPRQSRLKSWCGQQLAVIAHRAVCLGGLSPSCMQAVNHERATAERPALSHGCFGSSAWVPCWSGCRRHCGPTDAAVCPDCPLCAVQVLLPGVLRHGPPSVCFGPGFENECSVPMRNKFTGGWAHDSSMIHQTHWDSSLTPSASERLYCHYAMDTLGFEPRAFRMRSGCDATTPCAP